MCLEADGGTRTASITGAFLALADALYAIRGELDPKRPVLTESVAAVSVGVVEGRALLDLDYVEDVAAEVDMNVVMTAAADLSSCKGTGEEATFSEKELTDAREACQGRHRPTARATAQHAGETVAAGEVECARNVERGRASLLSRLASACPARRDSILRGRIFHSPDAQCVAAANQCAECRPPRL